MKSQLWGVTILCFQWLKIISQYLCRDGTREKQNTTYILLSTTSAFSNGFYLLFTFMLKSLGVKVTLVGCHILCRSRFYCKNEGMPSESSKIGRRERT